LYDGTDVTRLKPEAVILTDTICTLEDDVRRPLLVHVESNIDDTTVTDLDAHLIRQIRPLLAAVMDDIAHVWMPSPAYSTQDVPTRPLFFGSANSLFNHSKVDTPEEWEE
jgi:hypothetical protein